MPFWKKMLNQKQAVYYPRAIVQGKPVETETIAKDLAKISTVSNSDVQAVLGDIAGVMHTRMSQGKSVHIKGLGYFRYVLDTTGVKDLKDFDFEKQVKAVRVEFVPERTRLSSGAYTRALVDSEQLEWIELSATTEDQDPSHGGDGGIEENPLGLEKVRVRSPDLFYEHRFKNSGNRGLVFRGHLQKNYAGKQNVPPASQKTKIGRDENE